jgi:hypothetical protein
VQTLGLLMTWLGVYDPPVGLMLLLLLLLLLLLPPPPL